MKPDKERQAAPEFSLKDADGKTVRLSDYKGKVVLLDFWATWCGPCKIEIPWLKEFQRKFRDRGFEIIGVSMDDEGWPMVKPFVTELAINYRIVHGRRYHRAIVRRRGFPAYDFRDRSRGEDRRGARRTTSKSEIENGIEQVLGTPVNAAGRSQRASCFCPARGRKVISFRRAARPAVPAKRGATAQAKVKVSLQCGYHVNSNTPSDDYLIPLKLTWTPGPLVSPRGCLPQAADGKIRIFR